MRQIHFSYNSQGEIIHMHDGIKGYHRIGVRHRGFSHPELSEEERQRLDLIQEYATSNKPDLDQRRAAYLREKEIRVSEQNRVETRLAKTDLSYQALRDFAIEYVASGFWKCLVPKYYHPIDQPRKYKPGEIVFNVDDDSTPYVFIGAGKTSGGTAWWAISPKGKIKRLTNIQYAEENRYTTKGISLRRIVQKVAFENS